MFENFKSAILAACEAHKAKGGKFREGSFFARDGANCPVTVLAKSHGYDDLINYSVTDWLEKQPQFAGINHLDFINFARGYDGQHESMRQSTPQFYAFGQEIRKIYPPG